MLSTFNKIINLLLLGGLAASPLVAILLWPHPDLEKKNGLIQAVLQGNFFVNFSLGLPAIAFVGLLFDGLGEFFLNSYIRRLDHHEIDAGGLGLFAETLRERVRIWINALLLRHKLSKDGKFEFCPKHWRTRTLVQLTGTALAFDRACRFRNLAKNSLNGHKAQFASTNDIHNVCLSIAFLPDPSKEATWAIEHHALGRFASGAFMIAAAYELGILCWCILGGKDWWIAPVSLAVALAVMFVMLSISVDRHLYSREVIYRHVIVGRMYDRIKDKTDKDDSKAGQSSSDSPVSNEPEKAATATAT